MSVLQAATTVSHCPDAKPDVLIKVTSVEINANEPVAFTRWRPMFHVIAPHGWMNDPCAPGYDSKRCIYQVNFQWNPYGTTWGNMSWGSATSKDLIKWQVSPTPAVQPTESMDVCGVFTGCLAPTSISDGQQAIAYYTSANHLPIHYTRKYHRGSERLHIATSSNGGRIWKRPVDKSAVVLCGPPRNLEVTGWRDPFVAEWPSMDSVLESKQSLYGIVSGGLRNQTPTLFLYRIDSMLRWDFLGCLCTLGLNYTPSRWSGDYGVNWEVANFVPLPDAGAQAQALIIVSVEGRLSDAQVNTPAEPKSMWMVGDLAKSDHGADLTFSYGGTLDHGSFYAANGFFDPLIGKYVIFGWITESELDQDLVDAQGWSGCLSVARVVEIVRYHSVVRALRSDLQSMTCLQVEADGSGTHIVRTLGISVDERLRHLRGRHVGSRAVNRLVSFPGGVCSQWEVKASFWLGARSKRVGIDILHSSSGSDYSGRTRKMLTCVDSNAKSSIYFDAETETVGIDRSASTSRDGVGTKLRTAPHTLFAFRAGENVRWETLEIHAVFDASVLEVFFNNRTVLTARVYSDSGTCATLCPVMDDSLGNATRYGGESSSELLSFDVWTLRQAVHVEQTHRL
ncbi:glycoside hydrolase family 32 protein [Baudoinia panamericana UAMH 10762]|uniref:Glycoside hydrolase family 32 protein n=1 Tax=Baudoinia panamericana (strain UAMH 10762) TaxID=717646 RepID=M2N0R8_BAUPA|nr:glycoside hydrolase family 32 protein [Baudoinia panamericana UAMH 10762]EMC92494.1 glycoside hydrolase family 32 protein [Baudoinia panamericana UAMH 10762]